MKITIEIAQKRMEDLIGENKFKIVFWEGTSKPAIAECLECGKRVIFQRGSSFYTNNSYSKINFDGTCSYCRRAIYAEINIHSYKGNLKRLEYVLKKNNLKEEDKKEILEKIKSINEKILKEKDLIARQEEKKLEYQKQKGKIV